jgi:hypothetical protein
VTTAAVAAPARTRLERLTAALPVVTVYFWLLVVYAFESWSHLTPWLFTDELETTQLSRSIAETGHAARRGVPHSFDTLYTFLLAPAWWIDSTPDAYSAAKYIGVATMTAVVFPAYWLARQLVGTRAALFVAAASAAIPAFLYSSMFVEEPLAYPSATLCLFLIVKGLTTRRRGWLAGALVASLVAPLVRGELAVIPVVYLLAVLFLVWTSAWARRKRAGWKTWDWVGAATLFVGAVIVINAFISKHAYSWLVSTEFYKGRMVDNGLWAAGALAIGLGILPVVAGLAWLVRPRDVLRTPPERVFAAVLVAAILGFGWYTAVKAAYISTVFSTLVVERNLIYLAPPLFVATALFLEQRRLHPLAVAGAGAFALYLVLTTPYKLDAFPYSDAPGLSILQGANRNLGLSGSVEKKVLILLVVVSVLVCLAPLLARGRRPRLVGGVLAAAAALVVGWNLTGQLAAADGSQRLSNQLLDNFPRPLDWLDRASGGEPVLYLGQKITDANGLWLLEFWNRSLHYVWSLDGTAKGPGPTLSPDLLSRNGRITSVPGIRYVVVDEGIDLVGRRVASEAHKAGGAAKKWILYRIKPPLRLEDAQTGIYDDGWTGADSAYSRYSTPGGRPGFAVVTVSRQAWGGPSPPGHVTIRVGPLRLDKSHQPALGKVTRVVHWVVNSHGYKVFTIPTPKPPFRVEVHVDPTFVPAQVDPTSSEMRQFGAQVAYAFTQPPAKTR